jgi:hypothetical protein
MGETQRNHAGEERLRRQGKQWTIHISSVVRIMVVKTSVAIKYSLLEN